MVFVKAGSGFVGFGCGLSRVSEVKDRPETLNPKPETLNLNPKPQTLKASGGVEGARLVP